jgi:hypothetical protein
MDPPFAQDSTADNISVDHSIDSEDQLEDEKTKATVFGDPPRKPMTEASSLLALTENSSLTPKKENLLSTKALKDAYERYKTPSFPKALTHQNTLLHTKIKSTLTRSSRRYTVVPI